MQMLETEQISFVISKKTIYDLLGVSDTMQIQIEKLAFLNPNKPWVAKELDKLFEIVLLEYGKEYRIVLRAEDCPKDTSIYHPIQND